MKRTHHHLLTALLPALLLTSCGTNTGVSGNYLEIQGKQMRMANAINAKMHYAGTKDFAGLNSFESHLPCAVPPGFQAEVLTTTSIDSVKGLTVVLTAEGVPGVNQPGIDITTGQTTKSSFVILGHPNKQSLIDALNAPANARAREFLKENAPNGRVITSIATTLNHSSGRTATVSAGATVAMSALQLGTGALKVKVGTNRSTTVGFSNNTVFAYTMSAVAWKKVDGQYVIGDLVADRRSKLFWKKQQPLAGTYYDWRKIP